PKASLTDGKFFKICGYYEPASQVGGDWWWQHVTTPDKVLGMLCDVSGHGVSAAMVTAVMAGTVETLIEVAGPGNINIEKIFLGLEPIVTKLCGELHWVSAFGLEFNGKDNVLTLISSGMPPCCILRSDGSAENIQMAGDPFGASKSPLTKRDVEFRPGDRLVA